MRKAKWVCHQNLFLIVMLRNAGIYNDFCLVLTVSAFLFYVYWRKWVRERNREEENGRGLNVRGRQQYKQLGVHLHMQPLGQQCSVPVILQGQRRPVGLHWQQQQSRQHTPWWLVAQSGSSPVWGMITNYHLYMHSWISEFWLPKYSYLYTILIGKKAVQKNVMQCWSFPFHFCETKLFTECETSGNTNLTFYINNTTCNI